jgi:hypothetical protein
VQIENVLKSAQGGAAYDNLATAFGVNPAQTAPAITTMLEALSRRIERNTLSRAGLADVVALLGTPAAGHAYADPQSLASPETGAIGNHVLDVLIGNKDTSRSIAQRASRASGLNEAVLKKMLPAVASMMIGGLQKEAVPSFRERFGGIPGLGVSAGGSPLPMPGGDIPEDQDADWRGSSGTGTGTGNQGTEPLDLPRPGGGSGGGMGGATGGSPLPIPGDSIPGLDTPSRFPQLPDVVRRGGTQIPGPQGGSLEDIIRSILGGLLGFKNTGILGWIMNIIFSRWFLSIAGWLLARMFGRR